MTWHYLPVFVEFESSREYSFCEVYLDDEGRVSSWTESRAMAPSGDSPEDLASDLQNMLNDLARWQPVEFNTLAPGITLEARETTTKQGHTLLGDPTRISNSHNAPTETPNSLERHDG